jgi:ATP-binding cassette subfamily B (MDR/TAP) protein 1
MMGIALVAAIASGVGIALQNIIFGQFVTVFTDFSTNSAAADSFRNGGSRLACVSLGVSRKKWLY